MNPERRITLQRIGLPTAAAALGTPALAAPKDPIEQACGFKLSRARFDADPWTHRRYLNTALPEQRLETYWPVFPANGKILGA